MQSLADSREKKHQQHILQLQRDLSRHVRGLGGAEDSQEAPLSMLQPVRESETPTNHEYLRNVVFKFMLSDPGEAQHLVTVLKTMLHFTSAQEERLRTHLLRQQSWFW